MIRGGLNGGATSEQVTLAHMVDIEFSIWDIMAEAILLISSAIAAEVAVAGGIFLALGFAFYSYVKSVELMCAYASGDEQAGQELIQDMWLNIIVTIGLTVVSAIAKPLIKTALKNKLVY